MSFASLHFFVFLGAVFALDQLLRARPDARKSMLLVASLYFYMCFDWRFVGLLAAVALGSHAAGRGIAAATTTRGRRAWLGLGLASCLGLLVLAKSADFFVAPAAAWLAALGWPVDAQLLRVALPVGISFYTFQSLSYVLDVYRGEQPATRSLRDHLLYVAFFPTLLAGPVTRARQLVPQIQAMAPATPAQVDAGLALLVRGFVRKLAFADVLAVHLVDPAFADPQRYAPVFLVVALVAYSFQIYMDVAGYTDIARGMARLVGFELPENFARPYAAPSVSAFWQRWHLSVSRFFRDYLFISLGGSRRGNVYANLMLTFVAIGLWHGAGWNFVVYGLLHGGAVCWERWRRGRPGAAAPDGPGAVLRTFAFVCLTRAFFRAPDLPAALAYLGALLHPPLAGEAPFDATGCTLLLLALLLHAAPARWAQGLGQRLARARAPVLAGSLVLVLYTLAALSTQTSSFAYFHF